VICIVVRNQVREACSLIRLSSRNFECVAPSSQGKAIMDAGWQLPQSWPVCVESDRSHQGHVCIRPTVAVPRWCRIGKGKIRRQQGAVEKKRSFADTARVIAVKARLLCQVTIGHRPIFWAPAVAVVGGVAVCSSGAVYLEFLIRTLWISDRVCWLLSSFWLWSWELLDPSMVLPAHPHTHVHLSNLARSHPTLYGEAADVKLRGSL